MAARRVITITFTLGSRTMDQSIPNDDLERIQRALNQSKREELAEKYGATFITSDESLPADVESEWLQNVEEFERQYAASERVTVFAYCGEPDVRGVSDIPDDEIAAETGRLLELMRTHNVHVHFLAGVDDREAYRFITEDLFREEMDNIRVDGMTCNFIYEEFYPNEEYDAEQDARWFLRDLFERDTDHLWNLFAADSLCDESGHPVSLDEMKERIGGLYARIARFRTYSIDNVACSVNEGEATYEADLAWEGTRSGLRRRTRRSGRVRLRLRQGEYYGWKVCSVSMPGLDD